MTEKNLVANVKTLTAVIEYFYKFAKRAHFLQIIFVVVLLNKMKSVTLVFEQNADLIGNGLSFVFPDRKIL